MESLDPNALLASVVPCALLAAGHLHSVLWGCVFQGGQNPVVFELMRILGYGYKPRDAGVCFKMKVEPMRQKHHDSIPGGDT